MIDQAGIMMAQGAAIASERIAGVNDNMTQPHYHNYYEIYYLEEGERYQRIQDELYMLKAGELMLFSPYIMHYSYGAQDMPFRRVILYFRLSLIHIWIRTDDPHNANVVRSQLRYKPITIFF